MTASLLGGVDFSSKAIHIALVPLDADHGSDCPPVTLRHYVLPAWKPASTTPQYRSVERCRLVRDAMRELLAGVPYTVDIAAFTTGHYVGGDMSVQGYVAHVCVEEPFGASRKADNVMRELYGAILASIPPHIQRDTIGTQEWRRIVFGDAKAGDWKAAAVWHATQAINALGSDEIPMDEHESEAFLIATAARHRLDAATRSIA